MFKYVVTADSTKNGDMSNKLINFFHVREIGTLRVVEGKQFFDIIFADGTITYGIGGDQYKDVTDFAIALR